MWLEVVLEEGAVRKPGKPGFVNNNTAPPPHALCLASVLVTGWLLNNARGPVRNMVHCTALSAEGRALGRDLDTRVPCWGGSEPPAPAPESTCTAHPTLQRQMVGLSGGVPRARQWPRGGVYKPQKKSAPAPGGSFEGRTG